MNNSEKATSVDFERFVYQNPVGIYILNLGTCDCSILAFLFDPNVPYIWVRDHMPNPTVEWWKTSLPISMSDAIRPVVVRSLIYDLQMETQQFLENLKEFIPFGIEAYQFNRPVPNTLTLNQIPVEKRTHILLNNGAQSAFLLPHACEQAQYWASSRSGMVYALSHPQVVSLAIER